MVMELTRVLVLVVLLCTWSFSPQASVTRAFYEIVEFFCMKVGKKHEKGQNCEKRENSCNKIQFVWIFISKYFESKFQQLWKLWSHYPQRPDPGEDETSTSFYCATLGKSVVQTVKMKTIP